MPELAREGYRYSAVQAGGSAGPEGTGRKRKEATGGWMV